MEPGQAPAGYAARRGRALGGGRAHAGAVGAVVGLLARRVCFGVRPVHVTGARHPGADFAAVTVLYRPVRLVGRYRRGGTAAKR